MENDIQGTGIAPDPKGNIELVRFGSTAILFCGGDEPFAVVNGYDGKTGEWSGDSVRVDDLSVAWDIADPEIIEDATVKWTRTDVADISLAISVSRKPLSSAAAAMPGLWKRMARRPVPSSPRRSGKRKGSMPNPMGS